MEVVGKTPGEVADVVEERPGEDYIRDAHVTVTVVDEYKEKPKPVVVRPEKKEEKPVMSVTISGK